MSFVGLFCLVRICEDASVAKVGILFSKDLVRICEDAKSLFFWIFNFFRVAKFFFIEHFGAVNVVYTMVLI